MTSMGKYENSSEKSNGYYSRYKGFFLVHKKLDKYVIRDVFVLSSNSERLFICGYFDYTVEESIGVFAVQY